MCASVCEKVVTLPKFWQSCEMNFEWRRIISKWNLKRLPAALELPHSLYLSLSLFYIFLFIFFPFTPCTSRCRSMFNALTSYIPWKNKGTKYMFPLQLMANWICNLFFFSLSLSVSLFSLFDFVALLFQVFITNLKFQFSQSNESFKLICPLDFILHVNFALHLFPCPIVHCLFICSLHCQLGCAQFRHNNNNNNRGNLEGGKSLYHAQKQQ